MTTAQNKDTCNIRIQKQTHEQLKVLCQQELHPIGGYVDKILNEAICKWKEAKVSKPDAKSSV